MADHDGGTVSQCADDAGDITGEVAKRRALRRSDGAQGAAGLRPQHTPSLCDGTSREIVVVQTAITTVGRQNDQVGPTPSTNVTMEPSPTSVVTRSLLTLGTSDLLLRLRFRYRAPMGAFARRLNGILD